MCKIVVVIDVAGRSIIVVVAAVADSPTRLLALALFIWRDHSIVSLLAVDRVFHTKLTKHNRSYSIAIGMSGNPFN